MRINADFSRPATLSADQYQWQASPQPGVERVMLDRVGAEKARATSVVRYAPGSHFPPHPHPGGEEILVLSGTFSDEAGDYPAGWYLRNPPGSRHQPFSDEGATIFVKLWQMPAEEQRSVRIDTRDESTWHRQQDREVCPLFDSAYEQVCLQRLRPGAAVFPHTIDSAELLVIAGALVVGEQRYAAGSWIRLPAGNYPEYLAAEEGVTVYLKTGHLDQVSSEIPA